MLHNLKAFGRILFGTPFWFISCTALGIWLVDPSGPLRRDEVPQVRWSKPSGNAPVCVEWEVFSERDCSRMTIFQVA